MGDMRSDTVYDLKSDIFIISFRVKFHSFAIVAFLMIIRKETINCKSCLELQPEI